MRIALALGVCLIAFAAVAAPRGNDTAKPDASSGAQTRESFRARINENVVTIMAGSPSGTDLAIVQDLAEVLDDGDRLRVLPLVGKGPEQNIKDVMFLRGVDMGVTQANLLKHFDKTGELGPNLKGQIAYIAKLFNEELHILVRSDLNDIHQLAGKSVNFGVEGSGAEITGRLIFEALGVETKPVHLSDADAIEKLKSGEIDATIAVTGKPAPVLISLKDTKGLKLLPVPYTKSLEDEYYPATLTHDDYPELIPAGGRVDTMSVCAVLVSFNWPVELGALRQDRQIRRALLHQFRHLPEGAAPSEVARGQFRRDARRLEALGAGAELDRPRQVVDGQHRAQPFRRLSRPGERAAGNADLRCRARRSVPRLHRMEQAQPEPEPELRDRNRPNSLVCRDA